MGAIIGLVGGAFIILGAFIVSKIANAPILIESQEKETTEPLKTYWLINSEGEKEYIMTSKSMKTIISELEHLSQRKTTS